MSSKIGQNKIIVGWFLTEVCRCIENDEYTIDDKRDKNKNFINKYNLTSENIKSILLRIQVTDFCQLVQNKKKKYEDEILFIFCVNEQLRNIDDEIEEVEIYIKFRMKENEEGNAKFILCISFHEREKDIKYLFR